MPDASSWLEVSLASGWHNSGALGPGGGACPHARLPWGPRRPGQHTAAEVTEPSASTVHP